MEIRVRPLVSAKVFTTLRIVCRLIGINGRKKYLRFKYANILDRQAKING